MNFTELKNRKQWVPKNPHGKGSNIQWRDKKNWTTWSATNNVFVFSEDDDIIGIDIDDPTKLYAKGTIKRLRGKTYGERSQSGKFHFIVRGNINRLHKGIVDATKKMGIEIFSAKHLMDITGKRDEETGYCEGIIEDQELLDDFCTKYCTHYAQKPKPLEPAPIEKLIENNPTNKTENHIAPRLVDDDNRIARTILAWFKKNKKPLCPNNDSFLLVGHALKSCGFSNDELLTLMQSEVGYKSDAYNRICTFKPKNRQLGSLIDYAKKHGYEPRQTKIVDDENVDYATVEGDIGKFDDTIVIKEQLTPRLPARGDSIAISGRSGGGKTTHAFNMMKDLQKMGMTNVLIVADMADWQVRERCEEHRIDPDKLMRIDIRNHRHIHIDQLMKLIKDQTAGRQLGIICIDNIRATGRRLWKSIQQEGDPKRFAMTDGDCADTCYKMVITPLAEQLDCVVMIIGHPAKNAAGKDKFPGDEQWTAYCGIAYRIYRINASNVDEIPKSIIKRFRDESRKTKKWTLATVFKPRYKNAKDYWLGITDDGEFVPEDCANDEVDLEEEQQLRKKTIDDPKQYVSELEKYLADKVDEFHGFSKLNRDMPNHPKVPYEHWCGIIRQHTKLGMMGAMGSKGLCHDLYHGKPRVWLSDGCPHMHPPSS